MVIGHETDISYEQVVPHKRVLSITAQASRVAAPGRMRCSCLVESVCSILLASGTLESGAGLGRAQPAPRWSRVEKTADDRIGDPGYPPCSY